LSKNCFWQTGVQGRSQTFSFGGATGGAGFATRGAVNGLCRISMQWHDVTRKIWGATGGARQNFGGAVLPPGIPLASPLQGCIAKKRCGRPFPQQKYKGKPIRLQEFPHWIFLFHFSAMVLYTG